MVERERGEACTQHSLTVLSLHDMCPAVPGAHGVGTLGEYQI